MILSNHLTQIYLVLFCTVIYQTNLFAQESPPKVILLTNARILDVETGKLGDQSQSILVMGNRIAAINSATEYENATVIDLEGRVVLPGLIDLHSHLLLHPYDEANWNDQVLKESLELRTIRATVAARRTLEAGFTTLRDLGTEGAGFADVAIRDSINQGIIPGPRVFAVTKALVTTGGYGPMGFDPRWEMPIGAQAADGVAGCRKATRQQIAAGADWIKIYADYRRRPGDLSTPTFSQNELNAIVSEATSAGIPVAAHAATDEGIRRSVLAGVKTIEHGYEASLETLKLMKENGVVLCPTLTASESIARYSGWNPKTDPDHPRITTAKTLMKNALKSGVTIACGSDVGVFPHGDNARELELMFAYGMPNEDVIRSATIVAARVLKQDELGAVKPQMLADLIVVNEDPTQKLSTLRNPVIVIKDGFLEVDLLYDGPSNSKVTASETQTTIPADNSLDIARQLRDLDMNSTEPQIIEVTPPTTAETSEKREGESDDDQNIFLFQLEKDGSYSAKGKAIAKGDLARVLNIKVAAGINKVKVLVVGELDYTKMLETQKWLKQMDIDAVSFEVVEDK